MIHLTVDQYGVPLAMDVSPADSHATKLIVLVLRHLAGHRFQSTALDELGDRGQRLSQAGQALGIILDPSAGGRGGTILPEGIRGVR